LFDVRRSHFPSSLASFRIVHVSELAPHGETPSMTFFRWRNVGIVVLRASPGPGEVAELGRVIGDIATRVNKAVGLVHLIRTAAVRPPEPEAREAYGAMMRDPHSPLAGSAIVLPTSGFFPALVTSIIAGLELLSRPKFSTRLFSDVGRASAWLAGTLDQREASFGRADELVRVLADCAEPPPPAGDTDG
jgi:hypothetical protein